MNYPPQAYESIVFKYLVPAPVGGNAVTVMMPAGAEILTVGVQEDDIYVWARVRHHECDEARTLHVYGTGHPISPDVSLDLKFLGTAFLHRLVFHVFEKVTKYQTVPGVMC